MSDAHEVVAAYWAGAESRDWGTFGNLVSGEVVYEAPQFRERVRGRTAYVRFNAEGFPGDWHLTVQRIIGEGRHAASWLEFSDGDEHYPGLCFFELDEDGLIARITDFLARVSRSPAQPCSPRGALLIRPGYCQSDKEAAARDRRPPSPPGR
jgi:predicted ester cyclase